MVRSGQILTVVNPEEPKAADPLHHSSLDGDGRVSFSLLLPLVHNQRPSFAGVEMEVVDLASRCQGSDLSVGRLVAVSDRAYAKNSLTSY